MNEAELIIRSYLIDNWMDFTFSFIMLALFVLGYVRALRDFNKEEKTSAAFTVVLLFLLSIIALAYCCSFLANILEPAGSMIREAL